MVFDVDEPMPGTGGAVTLFANDKPAGAGGDATNRTRCLLELLRHGHRSA